MSCDAALPRLPRTEDRGSRYGMGARGLPKPRVLCFIRPAEMGHSAALRRAASVRFRSVR